MLKIKTLNYDTTYLYPINAHVYIVDGKLTIHCKNERIPFGRVENSPSCDNPCLEVEVYTDLFEISYKFSGSDI